MRVACKLGREVLDEAARVCDVGVTTDEIDRAVHEACIERDCYPSPLNYYEFPKSCCTSVNEVYNCQTSIYTSQIQMFSTIINYIIIIFCKDIC